LLLLLGWGDEELDRMGGEEGEYFVVRALKQNSKQ